MQFTIALSVRSDFLGKHAYYHSYMISVHGNSNAPTLWCWFHERREIVKTAQPARHYHKSIEFLFVLSDDLDIDDHQDQHTWSFSERLCVDATKIALGFGVNMQRYCTCMYEHIHVRVRKYMLLHRTLESTYIFHCSVACTFCLP